MVVTKVRKIADRVRDFRSGLLQYDNIDPACIQRIFAVVITPQGLPRLVGITNELERLLPTTPEGLAAWEYLDVGEVELLATCFDGDLALADLIHSKVSDEFSRRRSMTNFLYYKRRDRLLDRRGPEEILSDPWFQEILATAKSWGLPEG
jgi:hypothetical protein